jgi:hypothetical protein
MQNPPTVSCFYIYSAILLFLSLMSWLIGIAIAACGASAHFLLLLSLQALPSPGMWCTMQQNMSDVHDAQADVAALAAATALASVAAAAGEAASGQQLQ